MMAIMPYFGGLTQILHYGFLEDLHFASIPSNERNFHVVFYNNGND